MGAQIAAHFANAGVPALLLDITPAAAAEGLKRARAIKPDPFFTPDTWRLITTAGFDEDLRRIADVDWVMEAVVERLDVKRCCSKSRCLAPPGSIVSSNRRASDRSASGAEATISGVTGSARLS